MRRLIFDERIAAPLAALTLALVFSHQLVTHLATPGMFNDWDFAMQLQWTAYHSVVHFRQLPLWNPYKCGGMPLLGNPQSRIVTPWFPLTLLFGPIVGSHLEVIGAFFVAWLGTYTLGRVLEMSPVASAGAASTFAASSWLILHASEGHLVFLPIAYAPWVLALTILGSSPGRRRFAIGAGAILALSYLEGSPYPPMFIGIMLTVVTIAMCLTRLSARPMWSLLIAVAFAAGFVAVKAIPSYELVKGVPRPTESAYSNTWTVIETALFSRNQDRMRFSPNFWGFHESGAYLGLFAIPALLGMLRPRRALPWVASAIVIVMLARGDTGPHSLWVYLHRLPIGSSMRLPSRLLMMVTLAVGMLAGLGFDVMLGSRWKSVSALAIVILVAGLIDNFVVVTPNLDYALGNIEVLEPPHDIFRQYRLEGGSGTMYRVARENMGIIRCYEYADWASHAVGADQPGYKGEQYLNGPGTVQLSRWTPNLLEYEIDASAPTELVVNQNYDPYWTIRSGDGELVSENGLLAMRVNAGRQHVVLAYGGWPWKVGAMITLATILLAGWMLRWGAPTPSVHSDRRAI